MRTNTSTFRQAVVVAAVGALVAASGCGDDILQLGNAVSTSAGGAGAGGDLSTTALTTGATSTGSGGVGGGKGTGGTGGGAVPTAIAPCQGHIYACGDLLDNDGDGLLDAQDPDCLGPCDNTEDGLYGGIPGQSGPACLVDCYFDQDSGPGNDDCRWNHACDPHEVAPAYDPEPESGAQCAYDPGANTPGTQATCDELYETQSQDCADVCAPLTPNGCDCFGCCELPAGSGKHVWLGSEDENGNGSCTLADVGDPARCHACLPVKACLNDCDPCELCIGKTTLPPECYPGGGGGGGAGGGGGGVQQCPGGEQRCGLPGDAPCPIDSYCITGCCQKVPT